MKPAERPRRRPRVRHAAANRPLFATVSLRAPRLGNRPGLLDLGYFLPPMTVPGKHLVEVHEGQMHLRCIESAVVVAAGRKSIADLESAALARFARGSQTQAVTVR